MQLTLVISLLARGVALDRASGLLTLLGIGLGLAPVLGLAMSGWLALAGLLMLALGIVEKYWAQRVALDADLFRALANIKDIEQAFGELDTALQQLGLAPVKPTNSATENEPLNRNLVSRSLLSRSQGALRLLRWQALCLGGQLLLLLVAAVSGVGVAFYQ